MSTDEEVRAAAVISAAAWRSSLRTLISDLLDSGGTLEFKKKYVEEFGKYFNTFAVVGTIAIEMLGISMEHLLKVLFDIHPARLLGFYMQYIDRLLDEHEAYIVNKYMTCRFLDCI